MMLAHAVLAARSRGGSGQVIYYLFVWLWHKIGLWATPIYAAFAGLGIWGLLSRSGSSTADDG
jgi:hypothetical protein